MTSFRIASANLDASFGWVVKTTHDSGITENHIGIPVGRKPNWQWPAGRIWMRTGQVFDAGFGTGQWPRIASTGHPWSYKFQAHTMSPEFASARANRRSVSPPCDMISSPTQHEPAGHHDIGLRCRAGLYLHRIRAKLPHEFRLYFRGVFWHRLTRLLSSGQI